MTPVEEIKSRLSIVDVVSTYVKLLPAGKSYKGKSPFTNEKTPSFFVSPDKGLYHCFSTGKGGDMFTFVQEMEGVDFRGALKILADRAGVSLQNYNPKVAEERDRLLAVMEAAAAFYEKELEKNDEARAYLTGRGVEEKTIKDFRIGFAPAGWRNLYEHLQGKFSDADIIRAGLGKRPENSPSTSSGPSGMYDIFRDRIMFPICDTAGRVIAFSGRILHPDEKSGKYVNSPDTPLFNKKDVLFALDKAKSYIRKYNFTTLVEGQFDVIMLHQAGYRNTVGVSGTALSDTLVTESDKVNNLGLVRRLSDNLILSFDADDAGAKAAKRSAEIALNLGMDVKVVSIPGAKDPAEFLKDEGKDAWAKVLREAKHIIEYQAERIVQKGRDQREIGRRIREDVLPDVARLASEIEKSFFIKRIADITHIDEGLLWADVPNGRAPLAARAEAAASPRETRKVLIERKLFGIFFASSEDEVIKKELVEIMGAEKFAELVEKLVSEKQQLVFEVDAFQESDDSYESRREMLRNLEEEYLGEKITELRSNIKRAEAAGFDDETDQFTRDYQALMQRLTVIKNHRHLNKY